MRIENSFIPVEGVGEATERSLWSKGMTDWETFDPDVVGQKRGERIASFIEVGRDHLRRKNARFFRDTFPTGTHWRLYENFQTETCFLDIETTGLSRRHDNVTVVGLHCDGETKSLVADFELTTERLQHEFQDVNLLVTFNGKQFDIPFLESAFDIEIDVPHVDLMYPCRKLGLTGGLKSIERSVGIERECPDISGKDAIRLWRAYRRGDGHALETLLKYNREDVIHLEEVMDHVCKRLHNAVFESIVHSDL